MKAAESRMSTPADSRVFLLIGSSGGNPTSGFLMNQQLMVSIRCTGKADRHEGQPWGTNCRILILAAKPRDDVDPDTGFFKNQRLMDGFASRLLSLTKPCRIWQAPMAHLRAMSTTPTTFAKPLIPWHFQPSRQRSRESAPDFRCQ
jgi:hypothetical protein